jgi:hypothetical protein
MTKKIYSSNAFKIGIVVVIILIVFAILIKMQQPKIIETDFKREFSIVPTPQDSVIWDNEGKRRFEDILVKNGIIYKSTLFSVSAFDKNAKQIHQYTNDVDFHTHIISWGVEDSSLFLADEKTKQIIEFDLATKKSKTFNMPFHFFKVAKLDTANYLFKTSKDDYEIFAIWNKYAQKRIDFDSILPKIEKGGIITDGFLVKAPNHTVFHIGFYLRDLINIADNGTVKFKTETIDLPSLEPKTVKDAQGYKPAARNQLIHATGVADSSFLFILSTVKSLKENTNDFSSNSVIDIYNVENGKYVNSIYIPRFQNKRAYSLAIENKKLFAMYPNAIITYSIEKLYE